MEGSFKNSVSLIDPNSRETFDLRFPLSRSDRDFSKLNVTSAQTGFNGRMQSFYNKAPIGPYQGPYDQNAGLSLSIQLPESDMNFEKYTEFRHPETVQCRKFTIKESYQEIKDLEKVAAIAINDKTGSDTESDSDEEDRVQYSCQYGNCVIPCPCFQCCTGEVQCNEHKIQHIANFDENVHIVTVRSSEDFYNDATFMDKSYLIKHPGIPVDCSNCKRDHIQHICYHLDIHDNCRFCRQNIFKTFAETEAEFRAAMKKDSFFLKSVCPYCNSKFCDPYFKKKHVEFEHENKAPFKCEHCDTKFHSKQAKDHHEKVHGPDDQERDKCSFCEKTFNAKVSLDNHMKYAHSEKRSHECTLCEARFKQNKDKTVHMLNIHGVNRSKAMLGNIEELRNYECSVCDAKFKYKKDLNSHVRLKHNKQSKKKLHYCDQCPSKFQEKKSLTAHKKMKHATIVVQYTCPTCGKAFNQRNNMKRHQETHNKD